MKNVECNAKKMVVALVAKTIWKSKNGVITPFLTATNLRQSATNSDEACRKIFCNDIVTSIRTIAQKKPRLTP